jgi:hypothetical protein
MPERLDGSRALRPQKLVCQDQAPWLPVRAALGPSGAATDPRWHHLVPTGDRNVECIKDKQLTHLARFAQLSGAMPREGDALARFGRQFTGASTGLLEPLAAILDRASATWP